ncbi:hypothetical protein N9X87_00075 [bacterium]|nr:hypothetical protein [bacterium]
MRATGGHLGRLFLYAVMLMTASAGSAEKCLTAIPKVMFDTSSNCSAEPKIDRLLGAQTMVWGEYTYLVGNVGNDLQLWDITDPSKPVGKSGSHFDLGDFGDQDYGLYNFSVCDDCRYGVAVHRLGTVLFDLGDGRRPGFVDHSIAWDALDVRGAFTFKRDGQQYLIASDLVDECSSRFSTLYEFAGATEEALARVDCVAHPTRKTRIVNGFVVGDYLYLGDATKRVYIYSTGYENAPVDPTLAVTYVSAPMIAYMIHGQGLDVDEGLAVEANHTGMHVWDVSAPGSPIKLSTIPGDYNRAAVRNGLAFIAKKGYENSERTFDIADPVNPVEVSADLWDVANPWNHSDHLCVGIQDAVFAPDGSALYVLRYSLGQIAAVDDCPGNGRIFSDGFETNDLSNWK